MFTKPDKRIFYVVARGSVFDYLRECGGNKGGVLALQSEFAILLKAEADSGNDLLTAFKLLGYEIEKRDCNLSG